VPSLMSSVSTERAELERFELEGVVDGEVRAVVDDTFTGGDGEAPSMR